MTLMLTGDDLDFYNAIVGSDPVTTNPVKNLNSSIDENLLKIAAPTGSDLGNWVDPIQKTFQKFNITTIRQIACFLAQAAHESSDFNHLDESLSYSAQRLMQVWPSRFPNSDIAQKYAHNPQALGNHVYANRLGNGDEASGDGYKFRGGGLFQLTGRSNYGAFGQSVDMSADEAADYVRTKEGAAMSAGWFFDKNGLDKLAETPGVEDDTRAINGGEIGLADRRAKFNSLVIELLRRQS